jgi:hypothetical protein
MVFSGRKSSVVINALEALVDLIRQQRRAWQAGNEHMDRIVERAREAMLANYQVQRAEVLRLSKEPPAPMKDLQRAGPAWFVAFGRPNVKGMVFIEVDDATEQVTRSWATPK